MPGTTVGLWFALASGSIEPDGRVGVDLISLGRKSDDPSADVLRQRLGALERRFVRSAQFAYEPLVVFFQLRDAASGPAANCNDDDILTMALELFASQRQRACIIFRMSPEQGSEGAPDAVVSSIGNFGGVVLVLFLPPDLASSNQPLLTQISRAFPLAMKLILLTSNDYSGCPDEGEVVTARTVLRNLWSTKRILSAVIVWYRCPESLGMAIANFDPFAQKEPIRSDGSQNEQTCDEPPSNGKFHIATELNQSLPNDPTAPAHRLNLNRATLDIYGFEAAMAYRRRDIDTMPRTFPPSYAANFNYMDGLFGADVEALRELATRMNFTPRVRYTRANFGHRTANGSFTGALGHLVTTRDSWFSMNVYFLKDYETREVQFSAAVYQDRLCVFVKAAGMLPDWLLIFRCFTPTLWIVVWSTVALVSLCYVLMSHMIAVCWRTKPRHGPPAAGSREAEAQSLNPFPTATALAGGTVGMLGQIVAALLSAPTSGINRTTTHQKLFIAFGLIWGLTMTGAFQGSLVDVYTTPTSMKNLDTLAELDASRLPIMVNAPALVVDVFGTERPGNTIGNLKQRLMLDEHPSKPAGHTVMAGLSAGLIRNQDFVRLSTKHLGEDGNARLHRLRECPRSYTLAYLYPRGSPLYPAANWYILHFLQHGLYSKWERDATHVLAMNRAFKVRQAVTRQPGRQPAGGQPGQVQLRLDHLLVPFILLAGGLSLAGCVFACELLHMVSSQRSFKPTGKWMVTKSVSFHELM
ncbi:uncharacterized protein LOC131291067 [Anopheles ziemanni]|uniref:uncharacterized protein LOC131291067 n=1 Tax=Anopheles ziemanni TaxID=345580 RepID=UPI00265DEE78|nr:uncharacterized protein LOC131291067 [Anopheles ziemanni]